MLHENTKGIAKGEETEESDLGLHCLTSTIPHLSINFGSFNFFTTETVYNKVAIRAVAGQRSSPESCFADKTCIIKMPKNIKTSS